MGQNGSLRAAEAMHYTMRTMAARGPSRASAQKEIRRVIGVEARALALLRRAVGRSYAEAVELLARCRGKVIVTGVGKSGFIAQKIAATLSSTGTPAAYLDPGDALHGGLGFIQRQDLVLAVGKSGESEELNRLLPALRSIGARLIALTASPRSTLAKHAAVVLEIPAVEEACPLNLAPTASTTAALAAGDALAVALMKRRNFKAEHFAANHPAGQIGRRLTLRARDIMRGGHLNPAVFVGDSVERLIVEITKKQAGAAAVTDRRGRLVGLVTDYDIRKALKKGGNIFTKNIRTIMNPRPTAIEESQPAVKAIALMENRKNPFNVLPVVDRARHAVGMIQIHDVRARGL